MGEGWGGAVAFLFPMIAAIFLLAFVLVVELFLLVASFPLVKWWIAKIFTEQNDASRPIFLVASSLFSIGYLVSLSIEPCLTAFRLTGGNFAQTLKLAFFFWAISWFSAIIIQWLLLLVLRQNPKWLKNEEISVVWATLVVLLALAIRVPLIQIFEALLPYPHIPGIN